MQFVVGTYSVAGQSKTGTAWAWRTSDAADIGGLGLADLALSGPPGWNHNAPVHGCAVFKGMAPTICVGWQPIRIAAGLYTAGSWSATPVASSKLRAPRITKAKASTTTIAVTWSRVAGARSYIVAVTPSFSRTCCDLQNQVVTGKTTSYVISGVNMQAGHRYRVGVFALSVDVTRDAALPLPFDISAGHVTLVAGGAGKGRGGGNGNGSSGRLKPIKGAVHGAALVGSSSVKIVDLFVQGVPAKSTVVFRCRKGCSVTEDLSGSGVVHSRNLRNVTVPIGAVIEVRVSKPGYKTFVDRLLIHPNPLGFFTETKK